MDFDDDCSNDENTKIPVQDRVGENNTATPVVQNQPETEGNPEGKNPTTQRKQKPSPAGKIWITLHFQHNMRRKRKRTQVV